MGTKISALPAGTTPVGTEVSPGVQSGVTVKFSLAQIAGALSIAALSLAGNATGSVANAANIGLGATLAFSGSNLQTVALTGDITSSANSFVTTLASSISGAKTWTGNQTVSGASFGLSGNISAAAWTTSGIRYKNVAATLTDTTSSGTVTAAYTDVWGGNTIAASSATTFTNYYGAYFNVPVVGTNVTFTNGWALGADSALINGIVKATGQIITTANGALSSSTGPGFTATGTWITGVSTTTTKPYVLIEPAGTASNAWSTNGTGLGINSASAFMGLLISAQVGASAQFYLDYQGNIGIASTIGATFGSFYDTSAHALTVASNIGRTIRIGGTQTTNGISIASNGYLAFNSVTPNGSNDAANPTNNDTFLTRAGVATLQHGGADVASGAVAQFIRAQSNTGASTTGPNFTIQGTTGTTIGGAFILQTALTTTYADAFRLTPAKSVVLNNAAIATNATDGFLYIASGAGTPTGVPTSFTGRVALYYDTTNHQFWIYDGAWLQPKTPAGAAIVTWQ